MNRGAKIKISSNWAVMQSVIISRRKRQSTRERTIRTEVNLSWRVLQKLSNHVHYLFIDLSQ